MAISSLGIPRVVAFDLDGTLAESKQLMTLEMGELLAKLLSRVPVAVMSGAGFKQYERQFLSVLPPHTDLSRLHLFPTNAAAYYVFRVGHWRPVYDHSFTETERTTIHAAIEEALTETGLSETEGEIHGKRIEDRGAQITFSGLGQEAPVTAKEGWDPTWEKRRRLRDALLAKIPGFSIKIGGMTSVDITRANLDKAHGVEELAKIHQCLPSEMLYVGDALEPGGNDEVVIKTGIRTAPVFGPQETASVIEELLKKL